MNDENQNEVLNVVKDVIINIQEMMKEMKKSLDVVVSDQLISKQQIKEIRNMCNLEKYITKNNPNLIEETKSLIGTIAIKMEEINQKIDALSNYMTIV